MPNLDSIDRCELEAFQDGVVAKVCADLEPPVPKQPVVLQTRRAEVPVANSIVCLAAGHFTPQVSRIWRGNQIAEYLMATDARRHLWHACLASLSGACSDGEISPDELYSRLTYLKAQDLAADAYGGRPRGLLKVLGKLGTRARQPEVYRSLFKALLAEGHGAKVVRHATDLDDRLILAVGAVPEELATRSVFAQIANKDLTADDVRFIEWALKRIEVLFGAGAAESIKRSECLVQSIYRSMDSFAFPTAPWPGDERLKPVTSKEELQRIAERFENCLTNSWRASTALSEVLGGQTYFYEWRGAEPALLEIKRITPLGWYLQELQGLKNEDVSDETRRIIEEAMLASGVFYPFRPADDPGEPTLFD